MTHRGPFQPLPFCDSVILSSQPDSLPAVEGSSPAVLLSDTSGCCEAGSWHPGTAWMEGRLQAE